MTDYVRPNSSFFGDKDVLPTGNASKVIVGAEFDTEFNAIVVATNSKFDSTDVNVNNGIAGLDATSLLSPAVIPNATTLAVGGLETGTQLEHDALSATDKIVVPGRISGSITAYNQLNVGILDNLHNLGDAGVDAIVFWDDSDNAIEYLGVGIGLTIIGNTLVLDHLGIEALVDPGADSLFSWDDTANAAAFLGVTNGLEINGGNIQILDKAASVTDAVAIVSGDVTLDFSALTAIAIAGTAPEDSLVYNDNGVLKQIDVRDMGIRVVELAAGQTFDLDDSTTMQLLTGASDFTWEIPANATTAFGVGTVIYLGSRDTATLTISGADSNVRITSLLGSDVGPSAGDRTVSPGGTAALIKVDTNEWMITGDIG